jgi:hypothetical protein
MQLPCASTAYFDLLRIRCCMKLAPGQLHAALPVPVAELHRVGSLF